MTIQSNLTKIQQRIREAEEQFNRKPGSVLLLAVSKNRSVDEIREAIRCGQRSFGESYVSEAVPKIEALSREKIEWHFVGPIQSNKTQLIARHFDWVHSVDRVKIAERLHDSRSPLLHSLNVCIQVKLGGELTKSGVLPENLLSLAQKIVTLPNLKLRGLMTIPPQSDDFQPQRTYFNQLNQLVNDLNRRGFDMDTLSMGMSGDFIAAIAEGSTIIRVGTAIFGHRSE